MAFEVSIVIKADSQLEAIESAEQALHKLGQASAQTHRKMAEDFPAWERGANRAYEAHEKGALRARTALLPLAGAVSQATAALRQTNPALGAAAGALDNFAFAAIAGAAATGGWKGALSGLLAVLNPWVLAVVAAGAAIAFFTSRAQAAKRAAEEWSAQTLQLHGQLLLLQAQTNQEKISAQVTIERARAIHEVTKAFDEGKISAEQTFDRLVAVNTAFDNMAELARSNDLRQNLAGVGTALQQQFVQLQAQKFELEGNSEAARKLTRELEEWETRLQLSGQQASFTTEQIKGFQVGIVSARNAIERLKLTEEQRAALQKFVAESGAAIDEQTKERNTLLEKELQIKVQLGNLDVELIRARGRPGLQTEAQVLDKQIELIRAQREAAERSPAAKESGRLAELMKQEEILEARMQRLGTVTVDVGSEVFRTIRDLGDALVSGTLKGIDVLKAAQGTVLRIVGDIFEQGIRDKLVFEMKLFDNLRGLPGQRNGALASGASAVPGGGLATGDGGPVSGLLSNFNIGGFNLGSIGMMLGQGALGFGLGSLVGGGRSGSGIGGALGAIGFPGLANMLAPTLFGTATIGGAFGATTGALISNFVLPGVGAIVGGLLGSLLGGLFSSRPKKSTLGIGTTFEGIQSSPFGFGVGDIDSVVTAVRRTKGAEVGFPGQVESIGLAVAGGVVDVLNIFPELVRKQLDAEIAQANQAASAALNFTVTGRGKKFQRNLNAFMASLPGVVLDAFQPVVLKAFQVALEPFGVSPGGAEFFSGGSIEDRFNALQSVAQISARAGDLSKFFFGAEKGFVGQGLERLFNTGSAAETQAAAQRFGQTSQGVFEAAAGRQQFTRNLAGEMAASLVDAVNSLDPRNQFDPFLGKFEGAIEGMVTGALAQAFITRNLTPLLEGPAFLSIMERFETVGRGDLSGQLAFEQSGADIATLRAQIAALLPAFDALAELGRSLKDQTRGAFGLPGLGGGNITININGNVNDQEDVRELSRSINDHLSGLIAPTI